ncbi:chemotaxis protein CheA [Thalassotalea sp. PLHSN55]|uniref:chemotaxis protein CheA n=1 Tax=Thalassotalea sp. PLHSN55 TaxID=3435888 RepID=UPI003F834AF3
MSIDLSQFIPTFLEESFEGLELMETSLLGLDQGDSETINAIFRAAHSIKGGAGTFGFEAVAEFTHLVETLLDEMRDGRRTITESGVELLLESVDCMRLLIEAIRDDTSCETSKINEVAQQLENALNQDSVTTDANDSAAVTIEDSNATSATAGLVKWQIQFIPEHHLVQTGNDPILLFSALTELGEVTVECDGKNLPSLEDIDAEEVYLEWHITLVGDTDEEQIREIFEWVEDECVLIITQAPLTETTNVVEGKNNNDCTEELAVNNADIHANSVAKTPDARQVTAISTGNTAQATAPEILNQNAVENPIQPEPVSSSNLPNNTNSQSTTASKGKADAGSIRVGVDKVDSLINLVGELVITQSMLSELGTDFELSKVEKLSAGLEQLLQNTKELQESVMRIRMLPISFAFNRFPRLVHDLEKKTGKVIDLITYGEQTELDKTVMEQIGDPLIHLVRNAVDHGIEPADVRLSKGKSEKGQVVLNAYHQGGSIVIEISDDGSGINREAVFNKAKEKGIIDGNSPLTDAQVFDLVFEPGFSTAAQVSDISGRGVGMDVVKKNIQALGGRIQVESTIDVGTTFKINLPLTLAILDGQLVRVGTETYIIPLITIVESLQTQIEHINRVSGNMVLYRLREDNVPVIPIYQLFNIEADTTNVEHALLVVVEADGQKIGLLVDDLLAQQQVVIKSLKDNYQQVEGISGATILGDGSVAMILDIPGMINMALKTAQYNQGHGQHYHQESAGVLQ